ncbi:aspartate carbamoyltransferase [Candidatus Gracilibacteria bacterium]|nr:aspartate carbamoyltransferase [Candidatus Gracilibacteria bacterium]MCF7819282.1 aspartate carbamoyltransferase [Candidatus Gracilibacteria bacterium]
MNHVLNAAQFDQKQLLEILKQAQEMEKILAKGTSDLAQGKILATFFYEPSTRTRLSFETAMHRLGGKVISTPDAAVSSVRKGETVEDTTRILSGYADVIAMRSKDVGYAERAAKVSSVPILNAGDGPGEHPTQSLLDLFTISKYFDIQKPLTVTFVGDLKYGRTVHSLETILRNFPHIQMHFVAPEVLQIPEKHFQASAGDQKHTELQNDILQTSDVVYATRVQEERFEDRDEYLRLRDSFIFDREKVSMMKSNALLLHPLPRVNEITSEVDSLPQAKYFEQARNGVPLRMALIARALNLGLWILFNLKTLSS